MITWAGCVLAAFLGWWLGAAIRLAANWFVARQPGEGCGAPRASQFCCQAAAALTLVALWLHYGPSPALLPAVALTTLLLLVAAIDLDCRLVLNELLLAGCLPALLRAAGGGWPGLVYAAFGALIGLGLFLLAAIVGRGALGMGDVKLAGLLGLALGYPLVLRGLFLAVLAGGLAAAYLLLTRRASRNTMIPYAPFLAAGGILALLS